jgi:hypothetical protein
MYDVRHMLILSGTYELPFGHGKNYLSSGPVSHVVGGWQLNTVSTIHSGFPFTVRANGDACVCGATNSGFETAEQVGDPSSGFQQSPQEWFNTTAFAQPVSGTFGTSGRNILNGPDSFTINMSLFRSIRLAERVSLNFRAEVFNLLNHTNFTIPNGSTTVNTSTYGVISTSDPSRAVQVGLKLVF